MTKEELYESITDIDEEYILKAGKYYAGKRSRINKRLIMSVCAAVIAVAVITIMILNFRKTDETDSDYQLAVTKVLASYPAPVAGGVDCEVFMESEEYLKWNREIGQTASLSKTLQKNAGDYYTMIMQDVLSNSDENTVCSPLNIYITFSMLAEITDGNTRSQILDMLGVTDIETLREQVQSMWESTYRDIPIAKCVPANSLWLDGSETYNSETLQRLAEKYYASTFSGIPGSAEMDEALKTWMDANTFGLLSDYIRDINSNPDAVLEMISTLYYKAAWEKPFSTDETTQGIFHGIKGDTEVDMMYQSIDNGYVNDADAYTAVKLGLSGGESMYLYLPDEGVNVDTLLSDPDILSSVNSNVRKDKQWIYTKVHISLPRFRVSEKLDLIPILEKHGVTDVLADNIADFSPLTEKQGITLSNAEHAAVLELDEEGVTGAAYTTGWIVYDVSTSNEIDLIFNRPFMFVVAGMDGSILFAGVVKNCESNGK